MARGGAQPGRARSVRPTARSPNRLVSRESPPSGPGRSFELNVNARRIDAAFVRADSHAALAPDGIARCADFDRVFSGELQPRSRDEAPRGVEARGIQPDRIGPRL